MTRSLSPLLGVLLATLPAACGGQPSDGAGLSASPAAAAAAGAVSADPRTEVRAAAARLSGARSYRAFIVDESGGGADEIRLEYVAPDRSRMTSDDSVATLIGRDLYLESEGRTVKQTASGGMVAGMLQQMQSVVQVAEMDAVTVESLGGERVDGQDARKYRIVIPGTDEGFVLWVGAGYPLRLDVMDGESATGRAYSIRYSDFNDPSIRVDPPG